MAKGERIYPYSPMLLYNLANDIVEILKGELKHDTNEWLEFVVKMYQKKTLYQFYFLVQNDGCLLSIETPGEGKTAEQRVSFMFSLVDTLLAQIEND